MSTLAVTNTFVAATTASASQVNTNFSDIVTYVNNRNSGSSKWDALKVSGASTLDTSLAIGTTLGVTGVATFAAGTVATQSTSNGNGHAGTGNGTGVGISGTGGTGGSLPFVVAGAGVSGTGGSGGGHGGFFTGIGICSGVYGVGGTSGGSGVYGTGGTDGIGVTGAGTGAGQGGSFTGGSTAGTSGMNASGGSGGGRGGTFVATGTYANIQLTPVTATPTTLSNGDMWIENVAGTWHFKIRMNGATSTVV